MRARDLLPGLLATCMAALGCGRRATPDDCRLIVNTSVELQMKEMSETNPAAVKEREVRIRDVLQGELKECEGRRVTDKTVACVRAATSSAELEGCLK